VFLEPGSLRALQKRGPLLAYVSRNEEGTLMTAVLPHHYNIGLDWSGQGAAQIVAGPRPAIPGGAPPEFDGEASWWSPEHLLLSSVSLCLMTTFQTFARRAGLDLRSYHGHSEAVLNKTPDGLRFTDLTLHVEIKVPEVEIEFARQLLGTAKEHCLVARTLTTPITLETRVLPA
jgi:organic hydroperoxide reductase OsmC/OhrA